MKKLVSVLLAAAMVVSTAALLAGCGDEDYPVTVANYTIDKEPQNVVVLDPATADIMSYIGYDRKFAGRSEAVTQENLAAAPSVGSTSNPDVTEILALKADVVFSDDNLTKGTQEKLEQGGVKVIKLQQPQSTTEVKTNYETVGKILGGKTKGQKEGKDAYDKLVSELEKQKREIEDLSGTGALNTICYLYMEEGKLKQLTNGSFGNILMGYTNCVNIAVNIDQNTVDPVTLSSANPTFVFYNDEATLEAVKKDSALAKMTAITNNKCMQLPIEKMSLPGATAVETLKIMIDFIYDGKKATPDEAAPVSATEAQQPATKAQDATQPETQPETKPATQSSNEEAKSVTDQYDNIDLDGLSLKVEDENDDVLQMQQRLEDLGYLNKEDENVTGYYGEMTAQAVRDFQKRNGIKETGTADNATLKALFMSNAKKAS